MYDDRKDFARNQRERSAALAADLDLVHRAFDLQTDAAAYGYTYLWNWLGVPIVQMPSDIVVMQEIIWATRPDVIVETGVARGGSLVLSASILRLLGGKRSVIGVDVEIRAHNRATLAAHPLADGITLVEGSSIDPGTRARVAALIPADSTVMVVLDSDHSHAHVLGELEAYAPLVTPGNFLVVADTGLGRPEAGRLSIRDWNGANNPATALAAFMERDTGFERDPYYNDKLLMTSSPGGYLRRLAP